MSARCKPGDLAYVVGRVVTPGLLGRVVIVERLVHAGEMMPSGRPFIPTGHPCWMVRSATDGALLPVILEFDPASGSPSVAEVLRRPVWDCVLRPIRPNEGEDESLSWSRPRVEETA